MNTNAVIKEMSQKMARATEHTLSEFNALHTGKASPSMVDNIMVDVYGSAMRLRDVAAITTPDSRLIQVQPWDKATVKPIEKALQQANLGINPAVDGNVIRLPLPELSGERRQEMVKVCQKMAEDGRVSVRHARREALDTFKKMEKDSEITEDDYHRFEKEVQQETDRSIGQIDDHLQVKEKELLSV